MAELLEQAKGKSLGEETDDGDMAEAVTPGRPARPLAEHDQPRRGTELPEPTGPRGTSQA